MLSLKSVKEYVVPLLKYAHERGVRTQINSNLTLDIGRYELIIPYLDVLHISHNWGTVEDHDPFINKRPAVFDHFFEIARPLCKRRLFIHHSEADFCKVFDRSPVSALCRFTRAALILKITPSYSGCAKRKTSPSETTLTADRA